MKNTHTKRAKARRRRTVKAKQVRDLQIENRTLREALESANFRPRSTMTADLLQREMWDARRKTEEKQNEAKRPLMQQQRRSLEDLKKLQSLSQKEAAAELAISPRTVRDLTLKNNLSKTPKGRISVDSKFVTEYSTRHQSK